MKAEILRWIAASLILLFEFIVLLILIARKNSQLQPLLKDISRISTPRGKPYSFARTQLYWWTTIIFSCFLVMYAKQGKVDGVFNATALILLGISVGTTASGRLIDNIEQEDPVISTNRHQNQQTKGFWIDILSDNNGVGIHRFQALMFNMIFGLVYIINFVEMLDSGSAELPEFGEFELGLLGISSGTYIALKFNENVAAAQQNLTTDSGDVNFTGNNSVGDESLYAFEDDKQDSAVG